MRKLLIAFATGAMVLTAGALTTNRAEAMVAAPAETLQAAIEDASVTLDARTVCRHRYYTSGRRCWWVPGGYWGPRWRHRYWGYRRWRRW